MWFFDCFRKKKNSDETLIIKKSRAYLCTNEQCKQGAYYSYKEAESKHFKCSECKHPLHLV